MTAGRSLRPRTASQRGLRETDPNQPHRIAPGSAESDAATTGESSQRRRELVRLSGVEVAENDLDLAVERGEGTVRWLDGRVRKDMVPEDEGHILVKVGAGDRVPAF